MLTVSIAINGREVAKATVVNLSNLADISDYALLWSELASEETGMPERANTAKITGHHRRQSVWALVRRIAEIAVSGKDCLGSTKPPLTVR